MTRIEDYRDLARPWGILSAERVKGFKGAGSSDWALSRPLSTRSFAVVGQTKWDYRRLRR